MKAIKASLITIALFVGIIANAQDKPLTFGVRAGMNISNFSGSGVEDSDAKIGFNVGATLDYAFTSDLYLMTGLEFTMKGAKSKGTIMQDGISISGTEKCNPMYLQVPVHIGYKLPLIGDTNVIFHAGPYVAYGIAGSYKFDGGVSSGGQTVKGNIDTDFFDLFKRFDFGLGFGVNAEFGKINAGLGCDFGLIDISDVSVVNEKGQLEDGKVRNMNVSVSLGYKF